MTLTHHYEHPETRRIFHIRDLASRPNHGFDLAAPTPAGYAELSEHQKLDVAEFIHFVFERRDDVPGEARMSFYIRDHANRPVTTQLEVSADAPARWADLTEEERFWVHEFIQFLGVIDAE